MELNNSTLHSSILIFIIENGYAPDVTQLAHIFDIDHADISDALHALQNGHGVVLHPNSTKIWVIHPFSLAPTNFLVRCDVGEWWGNCAWCSLGLASLIDRDVRITTTLGANSDRQVIHIENGEILEKDLLVHFPTPMRQAWDNVIYTCSTMLLFESEEKIDDWCALHNIPKGDVQPIDNIWNFSKVWYGTHLRLDWQKWTKSEATRIFDRFGLNGDIWRLPESETRF